MSQPLDQVELFDEIVEMEIFKKKGTNCIRLHHFHVATIFCNHLAKLLQTKQGDMQLKLRTTCD